MDKITFVNNQEPALNETNLNRMLNNIETAINQLKTNLEAKINGTILYQNSNGSKERITLSDNVNNYNMIKIFGRVINPDIQEHVGTFITELDNSYHSGGDANITTVLYMGSAYTYVAFGKINVNEYSVQPATARDLGIGEETLSDGPIKVATAEVYVTKVIGYN